MNKRFSSAARQAVVPLIATASRSTSMPAAYRPNLIFQPLAAAGFASESILQSYAKDARLIGGLAPIVVVLIGVDHRARIAEIGDIRLDAPAIPGVIQSPADVAQGVGRLQATAGRTQRAGIQIAPHVAGIGNVELSIGVEARS